MNKVHVLEQDGKPAWAILPWAEYEKLRGAAEMAEDVAAYREAKGEESFPAEMVDRILDGESPIRVFREHRSLNQRALAQKAGVAVSYLSQIESGRREGTTKVMRRIADALGLTLDDIT